MRHLAVLLIVVPFLSACAGVPSGPQWAAPVVPVTETEPVSNADDAADDPAIWVNRANPAKSLVVGTNKKLGLSVYALDGRELAAHAGGRMNNVDLRGGFEMNGEPGVLVAATNRTERTISLYRLDTDAPALQPLASFDTGFADPYGLCLYRDGDAFYVFASEKEGPYRQWRIVSRADVLDAERVREIPMDSQSEGCVVDDANDTLYIAEEGAALWKLSALPDADTEKHAVARVGDRLVADLEGVALYAREDGSGWLVLSSQGNHSYAVFDRQGDNTYRGSFRIDGAGESGPDGAQETDGLDVVAAGLGEQYPDGLLVVQDGFNTHPEENQNFKLVSWRDVARALELGVTQPSSN